MIARAAGYSVMDLERLSLVLTIRSFRQLGLLDHLGILRGSGARDTNSGLALTLLALTSNRYPISLSRSSILQQVAYEGPLLSSVPSGVWLQASEWSIRG